MRFWIVTLVLGLTALMAPAQQLRNTISGTPDGADLLAEGPLTVTVGRVDLVTKQPATEKGTLLFLTRKTLYYRPANREGVEICEAQYGGCAYLHGEVSEKGGSRKVLWKRDDAKKEYDGPTLTVQRLDLKPIEISSNDEVNFYLYFALERLQRRVDDALATRDERLTGVFSDRGDEVAAFVREHNLDRGLGQGYGGVRKYIDTQMAAMEAQDTLIAEAIRKNKELMERARAAAARRQAQMAVGLFQGLFAAIPDVREYERSDGTIIREERYDAGGILDGLSTIYQAQANFQAEANRLTLAKQALDAQTAAEFRRLFERYQSTRKERYTEIRQIGVTRFGLPASSPIDQIADVKEGESRDPKMIADLMEQRIKRDRGDGTRDNPFALTDSYFAQVATIPLTDSSGPDRVAQLAMKAAEASRLVPPGKIYDFDRVDLLRTAAAIACTAATGETRRGAWARCYSPRAAFAVWLLDQAGADRTDVTGEARERRAVALMLAGRTSEAITQAQEIQSLRKGSPTFHYNLARMYGVRSLTSGSKDDVKKGLDSLEEAMKKGFCDLAEVAASTDFYNLKNQDKARFAQLMALESTYTPNGNSGAVLFTNKSRYPLTNVKLRFELYVLAPGNKPMKLVETMPEPFPQVKPNQGVVWEKAFNLKGYRLQRAVMVVECDQRKGPVAATLDQNGGR